MAHGIIIKTKECGDGLKLKEQISKKYLEEIRSRKYDVNREREREQDRNRKCS